MFLCDSQDPFEVGRHHVAADIDPKLRRLHGDFSVQIPSRDFFQDPLIMPSDFVGFLRFGDILPEEGKYGLDSGGAQPHRLLDRLNGCLPWHETSYRPPYGREPGYVIREEIVFRSPQEKLSKHRNQTLGED